MKEKIYNQLIEVANIADKEKNPNLAKRILRTIIGENENAHSIDKIIFENYHRNFGVRVITSRWVHDNLCKIKDYADKQFKNFEPELNVYTHWNSSFESAPSIVSSCHKSLLMNKGAYNVVPLDNERMLEYSGVPHDVALKLENKLPFLTDVCRVHLLARTGGIWADATCYFHEPIPDIEYLLMDGHFFAFRELRLKGRISNWFLSSSCGAQTAQLMAAALVLFWREFDAPPHYHFFHDIFETIVLIDPDVSKEFSESKVLDRHTPHVLQKNLMSKFNDTWYSGMLNSSFVHKLTHKYDKTIDLNDLNISKILV